MAERMKSQPSALIRSENLVDTVCALKGKYGLHRQLWAAWQ